jgi:hypothetical protein
LKKNGNWEVRKQGQIHRLKQTLPQGTLPGLEEWFSDGIAEALDSITSTKNLANKNI